MIAPRLVTVDGDLYSSSESSRSNSLFSIRFSLRCITNLRDSLLPKD